MIQVLKKQVKENANCLLNILTAENMGSMCLQLFAQLNRQTVVLMQQTECGH